MQILSVKAQNFKGIKLVEIEPQKTTTVVGGKNRAGKSSLLDAIASTLGGAKLCPKQPIRDGETEARCEIKMDGDESRMFAPSTVVRTWRLRNNGTVASELEITTEDGYKAPTPQKILDDVVGPLGFDPEKFLRMKPKEQAEVLRNLVGLDFTKLDAAREKFYNDRTTINREGKEMKARFDTMQHFTDAPEKAVSVSDLMTELQRRQAVNKRNGEVRGELADLRDTVVDWEEDQKIAEATVQRLELDLAAAKQLVAECKKDKATAIGNVTVKSVEVDGLVGWDENEVQQQITDSESVNQQVHGNAARADLETALEAHRGRSAERSKRIEEIDAEKQKLRQAAKWPVKGLGYDESGVTLLERPFDQASATEQREAAFGLVAALNPSLRFAMIKDGSLLDEDSLADFSRIAAEKGFQLFIERVGEGEECTIVISDGETK